MADSQPIDAPSVDPSVVAAMQGGFAAPAPQMQQRMYDAPPPMQDSYTLPEPVAQAVQSQFAQPPQPLPPPQAPPDVPVGVIDNGKFVASPPPGFVPQPLVNPFPEPTAADKKAADAAAKAQALAAKADAQKQAKAAAYAATPQGEDDAAVKAQLGVTADQQAIVGQQGDLDAKAAAEEAALRDKAVADQAALLAKQDAARQEYFAQQKKMIDERGKAVEEAAKRVVDPNRFYNSMSTAQHIGLGLMTILAGAGQGMARDNGPNPVVKMMTDAQDKDIEAQKAGIDQGNKALEAKRQLQLDYGHLGDEQNAQWEYKKAQARTMLADQLEQAASHYKGPKAQLNAKMAADALRMDAAKIVGEQATRRQTQLNKDAELANTRQSIAIAGWHASIADREQKFGEKKFGIETADKELARQEAHDAKMAEIDEAAKVKAAAKGGKAPEGGVLTPSGEPAVMKNGEPYTGIPKDMYKDVYEKDTAFKTAIDAVDQLRQMREDDGGHINSHSSGARGAAQQMARLSLAVHKISGVRFTPEAMELANKVVTGDADAATVDSYIKTVEPQLDQFRRDLQHDHVYTFPVFNGDPKQFEVPDPVKPKSAIAESPDSKFLKKMEERAGGSTLGDVAARESAMKRALAASAAVPETGNLLADREARQKAYEAALANTPIEKPGETTDDQAEFIKMAIKALNSGDAKAKETSAKRMQQVADDEAAPHKLREQAQEIIYKLRGYGKVTKDPDEQP